MRQRHSGFRGLEIATTCMCRPPRFHGRRLRPLRSAALCIPLSRPGLRAPVYDLLSQAAAAGGGDAGHPQRADKPGQHLVEARRRHTGDPDNAVGAQSSTPNAVFDQRRVEILHDRSPLETETSDIAVGRSIRPTCGG